MATPKSDNTRIWDALGKTDPAHTKQFTRAGGFKGTAIKPMWANKQMTEFFGPCGIGWGMEQPVFNVVPALDEIMVFCTVGLWYVQAARSVTVYGVGGDKVVVKQSSGLRTDDEAFKKAYTDALGNAMKFIGVGADVHMGQFDDNKYVQEVRNEFEEAKKAEVFAEVERQKSNVGRGQFPPDLNHPIIDAASIPSGLPTTPMQIVPPELDFEYVPASGLLICRINSVSVGKTKADKEYLMVMPNNPVNGHKTLFYWHNTHRNELLAAKGKVVKMMVTEKPKGITVDVVLEIDGKKVGDRIADIPVEDSAPDGSWQAAAKRKVTDVELSTELKAESDARLLASYLEFSEEELREAFSTVGKASWTKTFQLLKDEKARREA